MFFPQLLAGPITHHSEIFSQIKGPWAFAIKPSNIMLGLTIFVIGLFKKVVLADHFAPLVSSVYDAAAAGQTLDFFTAWQGAIAFKLQLYFDFSGYSEMALGAARLFGIQLPLNFNSPLRALNVVDYWRRWHMTLSRWIRDYLFFPINARWKGAPVPLYLSLVGVMALVGLWHGAGWGFLLWGTMHGVYLAVYRVYDGFAAGRPAMKSSRFAAVLWRIGTLAAVVAAWVPFRANSLAKTASIWAPMFSRFTWRPEYSALFYAFTLVVILFCAVEPLLMGVLQELEEQAGETGLSMFRIVFRPVAYLCGFALFLLFDQSYSQFIYSQF